MRTQSGLFGRLALYAFFGSSIAVVSCGDDDSDSDPPASTGGTKPSAGAGGRGGAGGTTGGVAPMGGKSTTGGTAPEAGSDGGPGGEGPTPEAGAGGTAGGATGDSGGPGAAGEAPGGAGGVGGASTGEGGVAGAPLGGSAGATALGDLYQIYVGCADTNGTIQSYTLEPVSNVLTPGPTYKAGSALSFGALNAAADRLYVSHKSEGLITTFGRDPATGALDDRGSVDVPYDPDDSGSAGAGGEGGGSALNPGTQALAVDQNSDYLFAANYSASNVYVFELQSDGDIDGLVESTSDGTNAQHALVSTTNEFLLVPYTGSDEIGVYAVDGTDGSLTLVDDTVSVGAGTGPRHLAIHPTGDYVYSINEDNGTISNFAFDDNEGTLELDDTIASPVPSGFSGDALPSEIVIDPAGEFAYVANRLEGEDEGAIAILSITQSGANAGQLAPLAANGVIATGGATPRDIALSTDGAVLLAVNQDSDSLAVFNVSATGTLGFVSTRAVCDSPYFVRIVTP
jgi:6-phosphogluconolactonase